MPVVSEKAGAGARKQKLSRKSPAVLPVRETWCPECVPGLQASKKKQTKTLHSHAPTGNVPNLWVPLNFLLSSKLFRGCVKMTREIAAFTHWRMPIMQMTTAYTPVTLESIQMCGAFALKEYTNS